MTKKHYYAIDVTIPVKATLYLDLPAGGSGRVLKAAEAALRTHEGWDEATRFSNMRDWFSKLPDDAVVDRVRPV